MRLQKYLNEATITGSKVAKILAQNLRMTSKKGGPVSVVTGGKQLSQISVSLLIKDGKPNPNIFPNEADEIHRIQGNFQKSGKWKIISSNGVGKVSKKTISDDDMAAIVTKIFKKAGK